MRKQGVDAGLRLGRIENKLRLPTFLRHGVVALHRDLPVGPAVGGDTVAEDGVVDHVGDEGCAGHDHQADGDKAFEEMLDPVSQRCAHGGDYNRAALGKGFTALRARGQASRKRRWPRRSGAAVKITWSKQSVDFRVG